MLLKNSAHTVDANLQKHTYTAFVTDVFARWIVGWACATTMNTEELPLQALEQTIA